VKETDYSSVFFASHFVASVLWIGFNLRKAVKKNSLQNVMTPAEEQRKSQRDWKVGAAQLSRDLRELVN